MKALKKHNFQNNLSTGITYEIRLNWSEEQWTEYLREGLKNSLESILEAGKRIYEFKTESPIVQGGTDFSKKASDMLGISEAYARDWAKVGENYPVLIAITDKLPADFNIIKAIASQPIEKITWAVNGGFIHSDMKREDMGVIRNYDPEEVEKEKEALNEREHTDMSASSQGCSEGHTHSVNEDIVIPEEKASEPEESALQKKKREERIEGDQTFKLLEKELESHFYGEVDFSYFKDNCEIIFTLQSYEQLLSIMAKILKFNNEHNFDNKIDTRQTFLDLGYAQSSFIPKKNVSFNEPLYEQAVTIVQVSQCALISHLQRKLKVGYNRSARMIEQMEMTGIVSEIKPDGAREVLPYFEHDEIQDVK